MANSQNLPYQGSELEIFAQASNWKSYLKQALQPWVMGRVLEVGAGIGGVTMVLADLSHLTWTCLEPDVKLASRLADYTSGYATRIEVIHGSLSYFEEQHEARREFDTILYIDVLEHIYDDKGELARAGTLVAPGGHLIVVAPAHQWLFSEFDSALGHHRRYCRKSLQSITTPNLKVRRLFYLDSVGILVSLANRILLRQTVPTVAQVKGWDGLIIPISKVIDRLLQFSIGKTVVGVWERVVD